MSLEPYLTRLTARLGDGVARLPSEFRTRQIAYLQGVQNPDGGFSGREGGSDLYYTGFALRSLAVLDTLTQTVCERVAGFLRDSLTRQASVVDFFSLLYSCLLVQSASGTDVLADSPADWPDRVAQTLETFRTPDGGYTKSPGGAPAAPITRFSSPSAINCWADPCRAWLKSFTLWRRAGARMAVTWRLPRCVAAARTRPPRPWDCCNWRRKKGWTTLDDVRAGVIDFLVEMASPEGGLRANGRAPLADLLSTFTAAWTLEQLGGLGHLDTEQVRRYAESLERPEGGFHGGLWDEGCDVEYTFYGLGVLALLADNP